MPIPEIKPEKRTFLWMPRLDFYVFREFMIPFSVLIFAFTLLFMIGDVFNDVDAFLDHEGSAMLAVKYFIYKIPGNIRFVLPITVLLSCMYTLANFGRHHEITAMRASGISLFRCAFPIYVVAFLVMLVNFWFNETLVPEGTRMTAKILMSLNDENSDLLSGEGRSVQYPTPDHKRNWMFGQFNVDGSQYNVRLKFFDEIPDKRGGTTYMMTKKLDARQVDFIPDKGWLFKDCSVTDFGENGMEQRHPVQPEYLVDKEIASETPETVIYAVSDPEMLSIRE